ncbi:MAG: hypothetical protein ACRC3Y_14175 [Romboutsia sp.]|uniref:hypothetical protein n=1 Tax=Romboutsia sp. TaxID=1965302 RepID=UPI003F2FC6E5
MTSEEKIKEIISSFKCEQDSDIEYFLKEKSIEYEKKSKGKTYFMVDELNLQNGILEIVAYFTLAIQVLKVPDEYSNRKRTKLDGISAKRNNKPISEFPVYLIGQLAKNDNYKNKISGSEVIENALAMILKAQHAVGGRIVLVECFDNEKLIKFYIENGFEIINKDSMVQLIRVIEPSISNKQILEAALGIVEE